jgi:hypothetical protein
MKYSIEEFPNHDIQEFHVTSKVCSVTLHSLHDSDASFIKSADIFEKLSDGEIEDMSYLVAALFAIDGIVEVGLDKYDVRITKATLFDWPEIEEQVLHVIKSMIAKDKELVEMPRKVCTEADRIINRQQIANYERRHGGFGGMDDFPMDDLD